MTSPPTIRYRRVYRRRNYKIELIRPVSGNCLIVTIPGRNGTIRTTYTRRHTEFLHTLDIFTQGDRVYALVAPSLASLAVLDLQTGQLVAETKFDTSFCPVDIYVPAADDDDRSDPAAWPWATFGLVAGQDWGSAGYPTIRWVDLSRIAGGHLATDTRLGDGLELNPKIRLEQAISFGGRDDITVLGPQQIPG